MEDGYSQIKRGERHLLVCKYVQSPTELLSAEQGQEDLGNQNTTYGGPIRFSLGDVFTER